MHAILGNNQLCVVSLQLVPSCLECTLHYHTGSKHLYWKQPSQRNTPQQTYVQWPWRKQSLRMAHLERGDTKFDGHNTMDLCQVAMKKKIRSIYIQWPQSANSEKRGEILKSFIFQQIEKGYCQLICQVKDIARLWVEAGAKNLRSVISSWGSCIWASLHSFSCFIFFALSHKPLNK